jgi:hypothetical protein
MENTDLEVEPYGKVYVGPASRDSELALIVIQKATPSVVAEMAVLKKKNEHGLSDVLLRIRGALADRAGIDGKTLRYKAVPGGTGCDFTFRSSGREKTRMATRVNGSQTQIQMFFGKETIDVLPDLARSEESRPLALLTEYQDRLGESPSRLAIEREVPKLQEKIRTLGWPSAEISVDWANSEKDSSARRYISAVLDSLPPAMAKVLSDDLGREALAPYGGLVVMPTSGSKLEIRKKGTALEVSIGLACRIDEDPEAAEYLAKILMETL